MQYRNPITLWQTSYCACAFPWDDWWFLMGSRKLKEWWPSGLAPFEVQSFHFLFFEGHARWYQVPRKKPCPRNTLLTTTRHSWKPLSTPVLKPESQPHGQCIITFFLVVKSFSTYPWNGDAPVLSTVTWKVVVKWDMLPQNQNRGMKKIEYTKWINMHQNEHTDSKINRSSYVSRESTSISVQGYHCAKAERPQSPANITRCACLSFILWKDWAPQLHSSWPKNWCFAGGGNDHLLDKMGVPSSYINNHDLG